MRKTFRNLFVAMGVIAMATVGMTSCEPKPDDDRDGTVWGDYEFVGGNYVKQDGGANLFVFAIQTTGLETSGEGELINFQLYADTEMELKEGEYELMGDNPADLTFCPGGMTSSGSVGGTSIQYVEGEEVVDYEFVEEGTISVAKGENGDWEIKASFPGCQTSEVNYKGEITFEDNTPQPDYSNETTTAPAGDYAFTVGGGMMMGSGVWMVEVSSETNPFELADFIIYSNATSIDGLFGQTYSVDFSGNENTVAASNGVMSGQATPSYVNINCTPVEGQEGYYQPGGVYYLVSGTVTISADGMLSFECKSYGGQTIKGACSTALQTFSMGVAPRRVAGAENMWAKSLVR